MKKIILFNKRIWSVSMIAATILSLSACKDYLNIEPLDRLTGDIYYKSKEDVESNIASIYSLFFEKINESWVIGAIGEARSGEIASSSGAQSSSEHAVIDVLGRNDLLTAIADGKAWSKNYNLKNVTDWKKYYQVIQSANILVDKLNEGIPGLSDTDKKRYIAEATFLRTFTYFWMVRLYGDVVYYTEPYHVENLPREDMVSVMNKCIADLLPHKDEVPWTYSEPALRGARASRGTLIALLMHMNMWNAGFDRNNSQKYYEQVAALGKELMEGNMGAHRLLPLNPEGWAEVTKGRSEESLFEFYRSINYGDENNYIAPFGGHFLRWPYKLPRWLNVFSSCYFKAEYMRKLYPEDVADKRRDFWYEDMLSNSGQFIALKFSFNVFITGNEDKNPDNTFLIFRYPDAILLRAEALAELGKDAEAIKVVNVVRERAEATFYDGVGGSDLKDFIFLERARELLGEGHRYFDLVRTRRILNQKWASYPLTLDQYNRRAWTWPIDPGAKQYNPQMTLNEYWLTRGN